VSGWTGVADSCGVGLAGQTGGPPNKEFGALAGHEHPFVDGDPQPTELDPTEYVLEGYAGDPTSDHGREIGRGRGGGDQQPSLVLGKDATGGAQRGNDLIDRRCRCWR
jgi:hypothetical protein